MGYTPLNHGALCSLQWHKQTLTHTLSATCLAQGKLRGVSPKGHIPSNVKKWPLKSETRLNCSQVSTPMRTPGMQMSFPETVSDAEFLGCPNQLMHQLFGWLISDDLAGEEAGCFGPGVVTCGLQLWGRFDVLPNSQKYGNSEINIWAALILEFCCWAMTNNRLINNSWRYLLLTYPKVFWRPNPSQQEGVPGPKHSHHCVTQDGRHCPRVKYQVVRKSPECY